MRDGEAFARLLEARAKAEGKSRSHFVGALALLAKKVERASEAGAAREFMNAAAENEDAVPHLLRKSAAEVGDVLVELAARLDNQFSGSGGRGSAHIGDEVSDSEISFVADAGDDRNLRVGDGASHDFFVEGPQIF